MDYSSVVQKRTSTTVDFIKYGLVEMSNFVVDWVSFVVVVGVSKFPIHSMMKAAIVLFLVMRMFRNDKDCFNLLQSMGHIYMLEDLSATNIFQVTRTFV